MANNIIYQTLEDRDNADAVEEDGPYPCRRNSAWLGHGYYFWDYHIELPHWWGEKAEYSEYMICEAFCDINSDRCWDLHNEGRHQKEFNEALKLLIESKISHNNRITVSQLIEYCKNNGFFDHEAIRMCGINSSSSQEVGVGSRLKFITGRAPYYEMIPAIQICLINRNSLSLHSYKVIWPEHYYQDDEQVF
jgi:hypothetical protein